MQRGGGAGDVGAVDLAIGGVEAMSRVPMGSDGEAWPIDPPIAIKTCFVPQGVSAAV
ncbi:MAG: hypothetical protein WAN11_08275 [Syntrophobacteraceae bacterium]